MTATTYIDRLLRKYRQDVDRRQAGLSPVRRTRPVRAQPNLRTDTSRTCRGARGRMRGGSKSLDWAKLVSAVNLVRERSHTVEEVCMMMGSSKSTPCNYLDKSDISLGDS